MHKRTVDAVVIGSGSAGLNALAELENAGADWVLVESGHYGTTCARVGCMPSKLLVAAADAAEAVAHAEAFGIHAADTNVDGREVLERVRRERDRFVSGVVEGTESWPEQRRLTGRARFLGPTTVQVGEHTELEARAIVVATGSSPSIPPPFAPIRDRVLTSDDIFELDDLPHSLAVVGTGNVGLELGQAMHRLGIEVTFLDRKADVGLLTDPELQEYVQATLRRSLDLELEAQIRSASATRGGVRLQWQDAQGRARDREFAALLVATGRRPNLAELDLERSGLALDERGMPDWNPQTMQCADAPIFIAGDVNGYKPLLHEASDEGRIAGQNAARFPNVMSHVRRTPLAIVFTDPQMAIAGQSRASLDAERTETAEISFENQGRARVIGRNTGRIRLYATRDDCVLRGAELFGPEVEHMAHLLAWSIQQRLRVQDLLKMPYYHPVLEEGLRTGLRRLARRLGVESQSPCEDMAEAPGM